MESCDFELFAPDDLPPGPRNGFIEIWEHSGPRSGTRLCRFAFVVKVAVSVDSLMKLNAVLAVNLDHDCNRPLDCL